MKYTPEKTCISPSGKNLRLFVTICLIIGAILYVRYADAYDYDKPFSSTVFVEPTFPPPPIIPKLSPTQIAFTPNQPTDTTGWTSQSPSSNSSETNSGTLVNDSLDNNGASESDSHNNNSGSFGIRFGSLIRNASAATRTRLTNSSSEEEHSLRLHVPRALAAGAESYTNSDEKQNITVTKTNTLETASPGDVIIYRITVTNHTDESISNVTITDFIPAFAEPNAATPVAHTQDSVVWWENQTITPGETKFYVRVYIDEAISDEALLENYVEVVGPSISASATDTTLVVKPATPDPVVAPTVDTGAGIGILLITAAAIAGWGSLTTRKFLK